MSNKSANTLVTSIIVIAVIALMLVSVCANVRPAQSQDKTFYSLIDRFQRSKKTIDIWLRLPDMHIRGIVLDYGTDYVCLTQDGNSSCVKLENIGAIITPPGTFGDTIPAY